MEGDFIKINRWLTPLSLLYGFGVWVRNTMFETGILKSRSFDVPVISVGNITVGGSGKTPHVEYLIRLLQDRFNVAVLSRGYKRKTRGFLVTGNGITDNGKKFSSTESIHMKDIGDEPYQMLKKFNKIKVAVDHNRCHGIDTLMENEQTKDTDVILLDDAFQHRYVKPGVNILLVDYHRLIIYDTLLPAGRLREPKEGKDRADVVIVTKCPDDIKPMDYRVLQRAMNLMPWQKMFFTGIEYCELEPLFEEATPITDNDNLPNVLLITGIASPEQVIEDLSPKSKNITHMEFADHHQFNENDAEKISEAYKAIEKPAVIITTEKDGTRLHDLQGLSEEVKKNLYILPIKVKFRLDEEEKFNEYIIDYVRKNPKHSVMAKKQNDHRAYNGDSTGNGTRTISF